MATLKNYSEVTFIALSSYTQAGIGFVWTL